MTKLLGLLKGHAMRTSIRVAISVIAGFSLMWPLGFVYGLLSLPTFNLWGLLQGGFFSAWPTLSLVAFIALGYLHWFARLDDAPLLMAVLACELVLTGLLDETYYGQRVLYGLLVLSALIVGCLSFFAKRKIRVAAFAVLPTMFFQYTFPIELLAAPTDFVTYELLWIEIGVPLGASLVGFLLGSLASWLWDRWLAHRRA